MKKRILSILLCFCMALGLLPMSALAAGSAVTIGTTTLTSGKYYTISDNAVTELDSEPQSGGYLHYTLNGSDAALTVTGDVFYNGAIPALSITESTLTLTGSGNLSMTSSSTPAVSGTSGSLSTSSYTGNLSFSSAVSNAITNCENVNLETTGTLTLSGNFSGPTISCDNNVTLKGSTVSLTNSGNGPLVNAVGASVSVTATGGNLTLTGNTSGSPLINSGTVALSASGNLSATNSGTGMAVCGALTASAGGDITLKSTSNMAVGGSLTVTTAKSVTVSGGSSYAPAVTGAATITASGDISVTTASEIPISGTFNAGGMVVLTNSKGTTIKTADGSSYAYGGDISTSGLNISGKNADGTDNTAYNAPTVTTRYKAGSGYISYTPATTDPEANAKLELHNATINTTSGRALFLPAAPVDITVTGDNALTANGSYNFAIDPNGQAVIITGDGNLTLTGSAGIATWGSSTPSVNIDIGGNLGISTTQSYSISASGNVNISAASITTGIITAGNGSFTATAKTGNLTIGDGKSGSTAVIADNITLEAPNGAISVSGQDKLLVASGKVTLTAQSDIALTGTNTGDAIEYGTGVSITSNVGSINVTTSGYSCMYKKSSGAVTLNAAKDITLNAMHAAISATGEAVNLTAGGKLSSTSVFGFQVGVLTIKANEVSIEGTTQDGIYADSVSITNPTGGSCKSVSITATSGSNSRAAISSSSNITVKADDLFLCGNGSAKAISALGPVTIGDAGVIVGAISAGTDNIAAGVTRVSKSGGDVSLSGLNLSTPPAEATVYTAGNGYALFTPATTAPATLILHNATIHNATNANDATGAGIALPDGAVTIAVEGTNTVGAQYNSAIFGSNTDVILSGTGALNVGQDGISLKSTAANPHSFTKGTGVTLNGIVNTYDNSNESGASDTNTAYGNVTFPSDLNCTLRGAVTVTGGAVLAIPQDATLDLTNTSSLTNNGTILNNGTIALPDGTDAAKVKALKLTGTGLVKAGSQCYNNDGVVVKAITGGLTLTGSGDSTKTVAQDGYRWDGSTLTLGSAYVSGGLTLPDNVTINTTSGSTINGTISGPGGTPMHVTFTGTAPLSINGGISLGANGDTVTVQSGAHVTMNGSFSLGAYGLDGILNVVGSGTTLNISSSNSYAVMCGAVNVQNGASLTAHSEGSYGLYALTSGVSVTGGSTLTTNCDYGVYVKNGTFTIDESSTFTANAAVAAVCVVDTTKTKSQSQMLKVPSSMLPSGTKITSAVGNTGGCGYTYCSIANSASTLTATNETSDPATIANALGALTLKKASSPTGGGGGSVSSYTLTFAVNGGNAISSLSKTSGTVIDLSAYVPTRDGYTFAGWYSDAALTKTITSVTLTKNTTVYAKWTAKSANFFADVPDNAYYHDAVQWAVTKNITSGTSDTTFTPDGICTRAQAVTFLWRAEGSPEPTSADCPFTDVSKDAYYDKAVLWAVKKGITKGTSATTFSPDEPVTRSQSMTFLWRAAGESTAASANPFADVAKDAYYYSAVLWAVEKGVTRGTSATSFSPNDGCTRAQIVTFLYRYMGQ